MLNASELAVFSELLTWSDFGFFFWQDDNELIEVQISMLVIKVEPTNSPKRCFMDQS